MSYNKNTWAKGDVVTSAKLNNIENGIADGSVLVVHENDGGLLDKTWEEIVEAPLAVIHGGTDAAGTIDIVIAYTAGVNMYDLQTNTGIYYNAASSDAFPQVDGEGGGGTK